MKKHLYTIAAIAVCALCLTAKPDARACEPLIQKFSTHGAAYIRVEWDPCGELTYGIELSSDGVNWELALDFGEGLPPSQPIAIVHRSFFPEGPLVFVRVITEKPGS